MRSRVALITIALAASTLAAPLLAHAASIPFFGPIIDPAWVDANNKQCALGWGASILVINNIIRLLITLLIVFVTPLMIAYAGFLLVVNSVNPAGKEKAKHMIQNLIIGLIVALAAWLIVDAIMVALTPNGMPFGTHWYDIVTTGGQNPCLTLKTSLNQAPAGSVGANAGTGGAGSGVFVNGVTPANSGGGSCSAWNSGSCDVKNLTVFGSAASQASQICSAESANGALQFGDYIISPSADAGSPVSFGLFQINISANDVNNLGCPKAFSGIYTGSNKSITIINPALYSRCEFAVLDPATNIATAYAIYQQGWKGVRPGFGAWSSASKCNIAFGSFPLLANACEILLNV